MGQKNGRKETQETQKQGPLYRSEQRKRRGPFPGTGRTPAGEIGSSGRFRKSRVRPHCVPIFRVFRVFRGSNSFIVLRASCFVLRASFVVPSACICVHLRFNLRSLRCLLFVLMRVDSCNSWTLRVLYAPLRDLVHAFEVPLAFSPAPHYYLNIRIQTPRFHIL